MRYELPPNWHVRYDYHEQPRGISAVVSTSAGEVVRVGFAKYNPRDPQFSEETGKQIALGRALAGRARPLGVQLGSAQRPARRARELGRSIADELLASG